TIMETVDLHCVREERRAEAEASQEARASALATKQLELGVLSQCDVSIVLNPVEKEVLARELPSADVRHVPLLFVDLSERSSAGFDERRDIVFLGGFRHRPNI